MKRDVAGSANSLKTDVKSSYYRLIEAVSEQWELVGGASMSARQLSVSAGIPVSSIYHHFGSLEHLFEISQGEARKQARRWCDDMLRQLSNVSRSPAAFAPFFAQVVDDWAQGQRRLAFAWREGLLLEGEAGRAAVGGWRALWRAFWAEVAAHFSLGRLSVIAERVFENESVLHMFDWRRLTDRAGLDEFSRGLAAWLTGSPMPEAPWRDHARSEALRAMPMIPERDTGTAAIVAAAAEIVRNDGVSALTHRSVAEKAGLTLGLVSYRFKTKSALLEAAYEEIYVATVGFRGNSISSASAGSASITLDDMVDGIVRQLGNRGADELLLAVARDPSLNPFAAQLRYLRGRTAKGALESLLGGRRPVSHLEAALLSGFISSQIRNCTGMPLEDARSTIRGELELLLEQLARA